MREERWPTDEWVSAKRSYPKDCRLLTEDFRHRKLEWSFEGSLKVIRSVQARLS
jgi:hypothetical protein